VALDLLQDQQGGQQEELLQVETIVDLQVDQLVQVLDQVEEEVEVEVGIQVLDHPVVVEVQQGQAQVQVLQVVVVKHQTGGNLKLDLILFRPEIHQQEEQEIGMRTWQEVVILEVVKGNQIHHQSLRT